MSEEKVPFADDDVTRVCSIEDISLSHIGRMPQAPFCCPVCGGNGLRPAGFYSQTTGTWSASSAAEMEQCRSCDGTGIVWGGS